MNGVEPPVAMPTKPLHILIIEDHEATNQALARMLTRRGHEVVSARNGQSALELAKTHGFDLVISDIGLPDINGWDLLRQLRAHRPELRAIALSGFGYPPDLKRSTQAGFQMHLTKPAEIRSIEAAMAQLFSAAPLPGDVKHDLQ